MSLETMIRGTCEPSRLLDIVENFILFSETKGGLVKLVAKNHQYLGVNNAIAALQEIKKNQGRLGVFWHTQGSGKSFSMVFFAQKVLRKVPGNWTFVVVTDRQELDEPDLQELRELRRGDGGAGAGDERRAPEAAFAGGSPLRLHADPEVPHREGRDVPEAVGPRGHHRDDRRGAPQPVRHLGAEHAERAAQRGVHRASPARR